MTRHLGLKWDDTPLDTFADVVKAVGFQGVNQLLIKPTHDERENLIRAYLQNKGLSWSEADTLVNYFYAATMEAVELASVVGHSLALTPHGLDSLDRWLQEALRNANVVRFEPEPGIWTATAEMIDEAGVE